MYAPEEIKRRLRKAKKDARAAAKAIEAAQQLLGRKASATAR
jgi:hypothetical protein